jgi:DNA-binding XRE family transcriptional regulator
LRRCARLRGGHEAIPSWSGSRGVAAPAGPSLYLTSIVYRVLLSNVIYMSRFYVSFKVLLVQAHEKNVRREVPTIEAVKIGRNLRQLREDRLLTQAELAEKAGIALSSLVRVENDQVDPRFSTIRKLARALDADPRELTKGTRNG